MTADSCRHVRDNFYSFRLDASEASETRGARQPRDKFTHRNKNRLLVLNEPPPLPPPPPFSRSLALALSFLSKLSFPGRAACLLASKAANTSGQPGAAPHRSSA